MSNTTPTEANATPVLLDLAIPRNVVLKTKESRFTFRFRRVTLEDWEKYFRGIVHQTLNTPSGREEIFETETAQLELVDRALIAAEGYGDFSGLKNWKLSLPIHHRLAAGTVLRSVGSSRKPAEEPLLSDLTEVRVDATWSAGDDGKMTLYTGLVHRFQLPSIAQMKKFNFESARVRVTGTQENGVTTYPARQAIAMKIYDELIESVEGYAVNGMALADVETIKSEMDGAHKAEAALSLFIPGDSVVPE
ncbi:MAG: hypothetical protein ACYCSP_05925 [Acidobacteriaceae bacterium]